MNQEQQFFMVKGPAGVPKVEHRDVPPWTTLAFLPGVGAVKGEAGGTTGFDSALAEAKRLAEANPGQKFFVLGAIAVAEAPKPKVEVKLVEGSVATKVVRPLNPLDLDGAIGREISKVFGF